jgi:hypothetical protein
MPKSYQGEAAADSRPEIIYRPSCQIPTTQVETFEPINQPKFAGVGLVDADHFDIAS